MPSSGIEEGFDGRPIVDLEASIALGGGATLTVGAQTSSRPGRAGSAWTRTSSSKSASTATERPADSRSQT